MRDDLIFHITTSEEWEENQKGGNYVPESLDSEGFIHCSRGSQVEETANKFYSDKEQILLLVIDVSSLDEKLKYEKDEESGEKHPHIYGPLGTNAVIDKITIGAEDSGKFQISFSSKE